MLRTRVLIALIASLAVLALGGLYQNYVMSEEPPPAAPQGPAQPSE